MTTESKVLLIEGKFAPEEAKKILLTLLDDKIKFHKDEMFSIKEMYSGDTSHSEMRINALNESRNKLLELLEKARQKQLYLKIHSEINISLIE